MEAILILGFLAFSGTLFYIAYHFIRKIKDRGRTLNKKVFYPVLIGGFIFMVIGSSFTDTSDQDALKEVLATNSLLEAENKEIQSEIKKLEEANKISNDDVQKESYAEEIKDLHLTHKEELSVLSETHKKEVNDIKENYKEEIKVLEDKVAILETEILTLETETDLLKKQASNKATESKSSTSTSTGSVSKSSTTTSSSTTSSNITSTDEKKECTIKGSNSGIYHTPGSTHYNRTKNVAKWFCSVEEAIASGYRAPKN